MDKKKIITRLLVVLLFVTIDSYGQDVNEIKWECKDNIQPFFITDTCLLTDGLQNFWGNNASYYSKYMSINDNNFFFVFLPIGSGVPLKVIDIYRQEDYLWRLVAMGKIQEYCFSITVDLDSCNNRIVFSTLDMEYDRNAGKIKAVTKGKEISELSLSELLRDD